MEYSCHHRDRPGSLPLRVELLEEHWSYMDGYAEELIARGPDTARAVLTVGRYADIEVHDWEFGGRR